MTSRSPNTGEFPLSRPAGLEQVAMLRGVHANLRADLATIRRALDSLPENSPPTAAREAVAGLHIASRGWQLGTLCDRYCLTVTAHHEIEDSRIFPSLIRRFPELASAVEELKADHVALARLLQRVQRALSDPAVDIQAGRTALTELADHLEGHLAREEEVLLPALAQLDSWL